MWEVVAAIVPSVGMLFLFWCALKAMIEADRRERAAEARWNREHGTAPARSAAGNPAGAGGPEGAGATGDTARPATATAPAPADAAVAADADAGAAETGAPGEGGSAAG